MNLLFKTKLQNILLTTFTATLLTACGSDSSILSDNTYTTANTGETIELGIDNPVCQEGSATQEGTITDAETNEGVSGVTVEIAGCKVITDSDGFYKFSNIPASNRTSVNFTKDGYMQHSEIIQIKENSLNFIETTLDDNVDHWTYQSEKGYEDERLDIGEDVIYLETNNSTYTGEINLYYSYRNTTTAEGRDSFPGEYKGKDEDENIVSFVSYGLMVLELKDKENNPLSISKPITITVKDLTDIQDDTIPLWYYNEDQGIWIEKGYAQKIEDGKYSCEITHTGIWSISKPIETEMGLYKGKILDADENPMSNVRIRATGKNWITQDLTTDENGEFEVYVVPNEKFRLSAYDYKEKFGAAFPEELDAISAGVIIEE